MVRATQNSMPEDEEVTPLKPEKRLLDEDLAFLCNALGHPARVKILRVLLERECIFGDIARQLPLAQSTISQHLTVLKIAGMICSEAVGRQTSYCVVRDQVNRLKKLIAGL